MWALLPPLSLTAEPQPGRAGQLHRVLTLAALNYEDTTQLETNSDSWRWPSQNESLCTFKTILSHEVPFRCDEVTLYLSILQKTSKHTISGYTLLPRNRLPDSFQETIFSVVSKFLSWVGRQLDHQKKDLRCSYIILGTASFECRIPLCSGSHPDILDSSPQHDVADLPWIWVNR